VLRLPGIPSGKCRVQTASCSTSTGSSAHAVHLPHSMPDCCCLPSMHVSVLLASFLRARHYRLFVPCWLLEYLFGTTFRCNVPTGVQLAAPQQVPQCTHVVLARGGVGGTAHCV